MKMNPEEFQYFTGPVNLDTREGKVLGFTSDKFEGYVWKEHGAVILSFIISKRRGNLRQLIERIHQLGLTVKVPTPLGRMKKIVKKHNYVLTEECCLLTKQVYSVYVQNPPQKREKSDG